MLSCWSFYCQALALRRSLPGADIIERLLPEDSFLSKTKLSAVVEAVTTVIKDIDKKTFQHTGGAVRKVLNKASLQELRRIVRILPEVERRRKLQGVD